MDCHLVNGRPTYVCCWKLLDRQIRIIGLYNSGAHKSAPCPKKVAEAYLLDKTAVIQHRIPMQAVFAQLEEELVRASALLKGLLAREACLKSILLKKLM